MHRQLAEAICANDPKGAEKFMREHNKSNLDCIAQLREIETAKA